MSAIEALIRAGVDPALVALVAAEIAVARAQGAIDAYPARTARQDRNARYYASHKASETSETVLIKTIKTVSDEAPPPPSPEKETPPAPPKEKQTLSPTPKQTPRGSRLPEGWGPDPAGREFAVKMLGSNRQAHLELENFVDYWRAKAGANATKLDWDAVWRGWVRRSADKRSPARGPPGNRPMSRAEILLKIANPEPTFDQPEFDIELTATHVEAKPDAWGA